MNMKQTSRILSLLLAALLTASALVSCADAPDPDDESNSITDTAITETEDETDPIQDALDAIKDEANWGDKDFGILYANDIGGYTEEVEASATADENTKSGVINEAVYSRNMQFEDICHLNFVLIPTGALNVNTQLAAEAQTSSGDFMLVTNSMQHTAKNATSGYLYNYLDLNVDYGQAWWDQGTLDFALNGNVFFMNGPFNIVNDDVTFVLMFNKELRKDHNVENPYDTVRAGKWTMEYFNSVISQLASDDGDGKWNENDTYGFVCTSSIDETLFYGADLQYIKNDRTMDRPELMLTDAKLEIASDVYDLAATIMYANHSTYIAPGENMKNSMHIFTDGRALFYSEAASYLRGLAHDMDADYGILPVPKYSEEQENYTTWSHPIGSTLSIPTSIARPDLAQFARVLEVYVLLSAQYVRPAYYDSVLTSRNVRDSDSAEMLDLIFNNRIYDMAMCFDSLGFRGLFAPNLTKNTFVSQYSRKRASFDKNIDSLLSKLGN